MADIGLSTADEAHASYSHFLSHFLEVSQNPVMHVPRNFVSDIGKDATVFALRHLVQRERARWSGRLRPCLRVLRHCTRSEGRCVV